jgi:peptidoglycan/LPS O-acetylase OafA/YrhL
LDGVRALAVFAVVTYHLGTTGGDPHVLRGGFLGVDVFFVLSGYLITSLLIVERRRTGRISILRFYQRRARRLLPALFALLLVVGAIGSFWLTQQAAKLRGELVAALTYVTNWWLIAEKSSYFGGGDRPSPLTHLWSLAVEEQFYLVWPLVLILLARVRVSRRAVLTVLVLAITASAVAAALLYDPWADPSRVYYGTDTRALAPLTGALLAFSVRPWWHRPDLGRWSRRGLDSIGVCALMLLVVVAVLLGDNDPLLYRGGFAVIALLAAALVAVAGHPATRLGRVLGSQPLRWLGERSYAIYLWHWPICVLTRPGVDIPITGWANAAVRVATVVALAELSYRFVERPFRAAGALRSQPSGRSVRPPLLRRPAVHRVALATVATVAATGIAFQLTAAAGQPVQRVPVDAGPAATLGALPPNPSARPDVSPSGSPSRQPSSPSAQPSASPSGPRAIPTVAVFGDSQGMTLLINKPADLGQYMTITDATIEGCGVLLGRVTSRSGERRDLAPSCGNWASRWASSANRLHPQIALVMIGAWEVFDLTTEAGSLAFGSTQWDAHLTAALQQGVAALRASGANVALSLLPCYRPVSASAGFWPERGDDQRTRHVNDILRAVAAAAPSTVRVIEPPAQFCTDPAIATNLNYRWDGVHYYKPGAQLYFQTVVPQLLQLA